MNCREVLIMAPLYLSREMDWDERKRFTAHLAECSECKHELDQQVLLDTHLAEVLRAESLDTSRIEERFRRQVVAEESRRRWIRRGVAIAASVVAVLAGLYGLSRLASPSKLYLDAAHDHRIEIMEGQPRRWRTDRAGIEAVATQHGLSFDRVVALAPAGYTLERAKICGLDGQRMLHLVFSNGDSRYSLYLRPGQSERRVVTLIQRDSEQVAGFETGTFRAVVVTMGPSAECEELARWTASRL